MLSPTFSSVSFFQWLDITQQTWYLGVKRGESGADGRKEGVGGLENEEVREIERLPRARI